MSNEKTPLATASVHPQRQRIREAMGLLHKVLDDWREDEVQHYPEGMPSFDEFLAEIGEKLHAIEWRSTATTCCKTCGSEIVETVNDSNFHDGECGPCEYARYRSQPALFAAGFCAYGVLCDLSYHWCFRGKSRRFREANDLIDTLATALNDYGKEA